MNAIAVYHHPQECGSPYLTFISQETGEVVDTVDIPTGYYDSGMELITRLQPVHSFTETIHRGGPKPTLANCEYIAGKYGYNPHHYKYVVTKVTDIKEDKDIFHTWTATLHVTACIPKTEWKFSSADDHFRHGMEAAGFNMKGWCVYRRIRTPFLEFLKQVASQYKDYHLVNLIQIG